MYGDVGKVDREDWPVQGMTTRVGATTDSVTSGVILAQVISAGTRLDIAVSK